MALKVQPFMKLPQGTGQGQLWNLLPDAGAAAFSSMSQWFCAFTSRVPCTGAEVAEDSGSLFFRGGHHSGSLSRGG